MKIKGRKYFVCVCMHVCVCVYVCAPVSLKENISNKNRKKEEGRAWFRVSVEHLGSPGRGGEGGERERGRVGEGRERDQEVGEEDRVG